MYVPKASSLGKPLFTVCACYMVGTLPLNYKGNSKAKLPLAANFSCSSLFSSNGCYDLISKRVIEYVPFTKLNFFSNARMNFKSFLL